MKPRVLIVDDDDAGRITLDALLDEEGYAVVTAASREEVALVLAAEAPFEVALVDYHLGDGLGTDLLPDLRTHSPNASVAMLTGSEPAPLELKIDAWLVKGQDSRKVVLEVGKLAQTAITRSAAK